MRSLLLVLLLAGGGACLALGACGQAVKHEAVKPPIAPGVNTVWTIQTDDGGIYPPAGSAGFTRRVWAFDLLELLHRRGWKLVRD